MSAKDKYIAPLEPYVHLAWEQSIRTWVHSIMSDSSSSTSFSSSEGIGASGTVAAAAAQFDAVNGDCDDFYLRYHLSRRNRQGQLLEFELLPDGKLRYGNSSSEHGDGMIHREVYLSPGVVDEFKHIIKSSGIVEVDDSRWKIPQDSDDRQEIECKFESMHIAFATVELRSLADVNTSVDPVGYRTFYDLALDLRTLFHMLINAHFKSRPFA